jgi:hypothetical protein
MRGHVACMGDTTNLYRVLVGKLEGDHLEDLGTDGTVISKLILKSTGSLQALVNAVTNVWVQQMQGIS